MRPILKGAEPASFSAWKGSQSIVANWKVFTHHFPVVRNALKAALLQEQHQVCCYCERDITASHSHIEHLVPKSVNDALTFDYANLLASCEGESGKGRSPETCGHLKDDRALPVHPFVPECGAHFVFGSAGNVTPAPEPSRFVPARNSISILGLDSARLVLLRRVAIADADDQLPSPGNTPEERAHFGAEVERLIVEYSAPDAFGRLQPFATAVVQHLERYL